MFASVGGGLAVTQHEGRVARAEVGSGNRILEALRRDCPGLRGVGETLDLPAGSELIAPGRTLSNVYFPVRGVLSVFVPAESGDGTEVLGIGAEGLAGLDAWLGVPVHYGRVMQRTPGTVIRMSVREFCDGLNGSRRARRLLQAFTAYMLRAVQQGAVCNALHSVEQRTCRWLLSTSDRTGSPTLMVSQETLADMLGVRRQSVGEVAVALQQAGAISYRRSDLTVIDRSALLGRTCECYRVVSENFRAIVEPLL
jgi:CRP-like cAMP-binding protein